MCHAVVRVPFLCACFISSIQKLLQCVFLSPHWRQNVASIFLIPYILLLPVLSWWCVPSQPAMQALFLILQSDTHTAELPWTHTSLQTHWWCRHAVQWTKIQNGIIFNSLRQDFISLSLGAEHRHGRRRGPIALLMFTIVIILYSVFCLCTNEVPGILAKVVILGKRQWFLSWYHLWICPNFV